MGIQNKPVLENEDMPEDTFVYSDGEYDYCIVNGESLTKYYGKVGGEYESYPVHHFADPYSIIKSTKWIQVLLKYDSFDENPKYKHKDKLLKQIMKNIEQDIFSERK